MEKVSEPVDAYIVSLDEGIRPLIEALDREISVVMDGEERVLWTGTFWGGSEQTIIGYGDYRYVRKGKEVLWFLIGLAVQKNHVSLYVNAVEDNKYLGQKYASELGKAKIGASSISFRRLDDLNLPKLIEMLARARDIHRAGRSLP